MPMSPDTVWLARLSLDHGLVTKAQCRAVRRTLADDADVGDFAQKLIDDGIVENVEMLEKLAGLAMHRSRAGEPTRNPFLETNPPFAGADDLAAHVGPGDRSAPV